MAMSVELRRGADNARTRQHNFSEILILGIEDELQQGDKNDLEYFVTKPF